MSGLREGDEEEVVQPVHWAVGGGDDWELEAGEASR
jgi:hypothetical protein